MLRRLLTLTCLLGFGVALLGAGTGCVYEHHDHHWWYHDDGGWHHYDHYHDDDHHDDDDHGYH